MFLRLIALALAFVFFTADGRLAAQTPDIKDQVEAEAARLDALPRLALGDQAISAEALAEGALVWLEAPASGLYELELLVPGILDLIHFATADGRYDGQTAPTPVGRAADLRGRPVLGPLLLAEGVPYLVRVITRAPEASIRLSRLEEFGAPLPFPERGTELVDGALYQSADRIQLDLPVQGSPVLVEALTEPRANRNVSLGSIELPPTGLLPYLPEKTVPLLAQSKVAGDPDPLLLLRVRAAPAASEVEPNDRDGNPVAVGETFTGVLHGRRDLDRLTLDLEAPTAVSLTFSEAMPMQIDLVDQGGRRDVPLWSRALDAGEEGPFALDLDAGSYAFLLRPGSDGPFPAPYALTLEPGTPTAPGFEAEPNDTPEAARALPIGGAIRAVGSQKDRDFFAFEVPDTAPDNLWRFVALDAQRILVRHRGRTVIDRAAEGRRVLADALALAPGRYILELRAEGAYTLRAMDLGPRPAEYEAEPNDVAQSADRLTFGATRQGTIGRRGDIDAYAFRLDSPGAVALSLTPPQTGVMDALLYLDGTKVGNPVLFETPADPYRFEAPLAAGTYTLQLRHKTGVARGPYSVLLERLPALAGDEPNDRPEEATVLPTNGEYAGTVGGFDGVDQVFVPLPEGSGTALIVCSATDGAPLTWWVYDWSEREKLGRPQKNMLILPFDPDLGGAIRLEVLSGAQQVDYACHLRHAPTDWPAPTTQAGERVTVAPGNAVTVEIAEDGDPPVFDLDLPVGEVGTVGCAGPDGVALGPDQKLFRVEGATVARQTSFGDLSVYRADRDDARITLRKREIDAYPYALTCTLLGLEDLPRPFDMGPPAPFVVRPPESDEPVEAASVPILAALAAAEAPAALLAGDLPIAFAFDTPPPLAAYADEGQRFSHAVTLTNTGPEPLDIALTSLVEAPGWTATVTPTALTLSPGQAREVQVSVTAPPFLSPVIAPSVILRAQSAERFAAAAEPLQIDPDTLPSEPFVHWGAPDALRGGLNVLHYGLGARLIALGDAEATEKDATERLALHDGLAPAIGVRPVPRSLSFHLAAPAPLAGAMINLRSTDNAVSKPQEIAIFLSNDGESWTPAASATLTTESIPQYIVFDAPIEAAFIRFDVIRCHGKCDRTHIQELQAIAVPGTHPPGLRTINAADPILGGHVVWSDIGLGGQWDEAVLIDDQSGSNNRWPAGEDPTAFVIGFHDNRAALIERIFWIGNAKDKVRIGPLTLSVSTGGPYGPWVPAGVLPAPEIGSDRSGLTLDAPLWARYVRVDLPPIGRGEHGPEALQIFEAQGTSVASLWEDDSPRAAFEADTGATPPAALPPAGGPDRPGAVALPLDRAVSSSVVIERNEDWWRVDIAEGAPQVLTLDFGRDPLSVALSFEDNDGAAVTLSPDPDQSGVFSAVLMPGTYRLRVYEPPRSVVIAWDTSGSVAEYIPRTLDAVRTWSQSLQPGRDALQLVPFGVAAPILETFAETPEELASALRDLPALESSDAFAAMEVAAVALAERDGAKGVVIITDAETGTNDEMWPKLLGVKPRVVALSIGSDARENAQFLMDLANLNGGRFQRITGALGLADGLDMANALFREPKAYRVTATLAPYEEPEGEATLTITSLEDSTAPLTGAVEVILDASGSMLQRLDGRRRIAVAHDALSELVETVLPAGTPFAFRAFGLEEDACRSELRVPLGPLDPATAASEIRGVPAINLAKTAIADSLRLAGEDLATSSPPRVIVLVTDGEETCDGDPAAAIEALRASGLDVRVNIVGFAIDDADLAETFAAWADVGGGTYFDAASSDALNTAVADALVPRFEVIRTFVDGRAEVVARARLGETITVPAGQLTVTPAAAATGAPVRLRAVPDDQISLGYAPAAGGLQQPE